LAKRYGCCEADLKALFVKPEKIAANDDAPADQEARDTWNAETIAKLHQLYIAENHSLMTCASELGLSYDVIKRATVRFGFSKDAKSVKGPCRRISRVKS
jgi:hypothetical protein